jgi:hypothetical protein
MLTLPEHVLHAEVSAVNTYRHECVLGCCVLKSRVENDELFTGVLMMEAVNTDETSATFYQTSWRNVPDDNHLYIGPRGNLKSYHCH